MSKSIVMVSPMLSELMSILLFHREKQISVLYLLFSISIIKSSFFHSFPACDVPVIVWSLFLNFPVIVNIMLVLVFNFIFYKFILVYFKHYGILSCHKNGK